MDGIRWLKLTDDERDDFLETGGTGVLSFDTDADEPPASFPVSYGYAADTGDFYFRLSVPTGSTKAALIDRLVSFVTYGRADDRWRSVVATGSLEELAEQPHESVAVQGLWAVDIPMIDIFDRPRSEIEFHDVRLVPESITGRKSVDE